MITNLIGWAIFGLIAGAIARFLMPGRDPMGCLATMALGVVGSFVGGFLGTLIFGGPGGRMHAGGWIASILGAILVLWLYRKYELRSR
jgi:uncharacterized membrane protein YeaQ/YmgE (transglycosylase-associated protein family)